MSENSILAAERTGVIPSGLAEAMTRDFARHSDDAAGAMRGIWEGAKRGPIVYRDAQYQYRSLGRGLYIMV